MRNQLLRLSNKAERRIGEILKKNRIKFRVRERVGKYEVDFIIGKIALEIDGSVHKQTNSNKDIYLFSQGLVPIHISGKFNKTIEKEILYLIYENNK